LTRFARIRGAGLVLLLLLSACSGGRPRLGVNQPGIDVARAALRGGSPQVALQVTQGLLAQNPADEPALILQGDALTTLGRLDEAATSYTEVLKRDPASVNAHIGLGRLRLATNPSQAEALFLEALDADPRNTTALNDLGIARDLQGRHTDAQQAYSKALGIDPALHAAQVNLALSLAMSGDSGPAVKLLQPLASEPGASKKLRHDLAAVLAMGGNRAEAERILRADLTPAEIQQALADYAAARSGGGPPPVSATPPAYVPAPAGTPPRAAAPAPPRASAQARVPAPAAAAASPRVSAQAAAPPRSAATPPPYEPAQASVPPPASATPPPRVSAQAAAPPPASATSPRASAAMDGVQVQFTATPSENAAQAEWQRLKERMPDLLAGREPMFIKVVNASQTFWRVRTDGFATVADAHAFCARVRAAGGACMVYQER